MTHFQAIQRTIAALLDLPSRLEQLHSSLETTAVGLRNCLRSLERAREEAPTCSVVLCGMTLPREPSPVRATDSGFMVRSVGRPAEPVCAAWTGKLERYELHSGTVLYRAQGQIAIPYTIAAGAVLCSVDGAMLRSVRIGVEEQFANNDSCGPVCVLRRIDVGNYLQFTLEKKLS